MKSVFICLFLFVASWNVDVVSGVQVSILDHEGEMCGNGRGARQETDIMECQISFWLLMSKLCLWEREINSVLFKSFYFVHL